MPQSRQAHAHSCSICGKVYSKAAHLKRHQKSHATSESHPFKCDQCSRTFTRRDHYNFHLNSHEATIDYACHICARKYKHGISLQRHLRARHLLEWNIHSDLATAIPLGSRTKKQQQPRRKRHKALVDDDEDSCSSEPSDSPAESQSQSRTRKPRRRRSDEDPTWRGLQVSQPSAPPRATRASFAASQRAATSNSEDDVAQSHGALAEQRARSRSAKRESEDSAAMGSIASMSSSSALSSSRALDDSDRLLKPFDSISPYEAAASLTGSQHVISTMNRRQSRLADPAMSGSLGYPDCSSAATRSATQHATQPLRRQTADSTSSVSLEVVLQQLKQMAEADKAAQSATTTVVPQQLSMSHMAHPDVASSSSRRIASNPVDYFDHHHQTIHQPRQQFAGLDQSDQTQPQVNYQRILRQPQQLQPLHKLQEQLEEQQRQLRLLLLQQQEHQALASMSQSVSFAPSLNQGQEHPHQSLTDHYRNSSQQLSSTFNSLTQQLMIGAPAPKQFSSQLPSLSASPLSVACAETQRAVPLNLSPFSLDNAVPSTSSRSLAMPLSGNPSINDAPVTMATGMTQAAFESLLNDYNGQTDF